MKLTPWLISWPFIYIRVVPALFFIGMSWWKQDALYLLPAFIFSLNAVMARAVRKKYPPTE